MKKLVIAIDGPAASGKSTTARLTAERLGYLFIDTGAMYRAVTLKALEEKLDVGDERLIGKLAQEMQLTFEHSRDEFKVKVNGRDVTRAIRSPAVTKAVSRVSAHKAVREIMVRQQRSIARAGGVVIEGRDIGTVVLPHADLKIYLVADVKERARRRARELQGGGIEVPVDTLKDELEERDLRDASRVNSPLRKAPDAIELDTSRLTVEQQVEYVVQKAREILRSRA
ncbi:MAG: cytidylate kinase [Ignavibacteria bacterium 13_1_40CM_2_61_4]|nr:MAG: cytidylate kinase [Ignavibacteria bacterium 13_1_40CM_2_61_4]